MDQRGEALDASPTAVAALIPALPVAYCATFGKPLGLLEKLDISRCKMKGLDNEHL